MDKISACRAQDSGLGIIKLSTPNFLRTVENCIREGPESVWHQNMEKQQFGKWFQHVSTCFNMFQSSSNGISVFGCRICFVLLEDTQIIPDLPGNAVLLENVEEVLDPSLEPVLLKQVFKKGGQLLLRLGSEDVSGNSDWSDWECLGQEMGRVQTIDY